MALTPAQRAKRYRDGKKDNNVTERHETATPTVTATTYQLPALPIDSVVSLNSQIGWADILAMPAEAIDLAYDTYKRDDAKHGQSWLLRLKRAAGYHKRVEEPGATVQTIGAIV